MDFKPNTAPIEVIKKGAFEGTYFRDIYSSVTDNCIRTHGKNLMC